MQLRQNSKSAAVNNILYIYVLYRSAIPNFFNAEDPYFNVKNNLSEKKEVGSK